MPSYNASLGAQAEQEVRKRDMDRMDRDKSAIEHRIERLDTYLDLCGDLLSQLESRLNPVLPPSYFTDSDKSQVEPSLPSSPLACEMERLGYRLETVSQRMNELLEHMEL